MSKAKLTNMIGAIEAMHAIVCDKSTQCDRAGDVIVSIKIDGKWYEVIRLTEACDYFSGEITRYGLSRTIVRENARNHQPTKDDNWEP